MKIETRCNIDLSSLQAWLTDNNWHSVQIAAPRPGLVTFTEPDGYAWLEKYLVQMFDSQFKYVGGKIEVLA